jgi:hypothetical protein
MCGEKMKENEDEIVPLASFQGEQEANIVKGILESGGIKVMLRGDNVQSVLPITADGLGKVTVCVFRKDLEEARAVLEEEPDYDESNINWMYPESDTKH